MTTNNPRLSGKRQILYQGNKTVEEPLNDPIKPATKKTNPTTKNASQDKNNAIGGTLEERTTSIYKWLKTHHLVKLNKICEICGIDRANFVKGVASNKPIKQEVLEKIEKLLKQYGYE